MNRRIARLALAGMILFASSSLMAQDKQEQERIDKEANARAEESRRNSPFILNQPAFSQGDTLRLIYRPQFAGHNDSAGVKASVYIYRNFNWEGFDLPIAKTEKGWESSYIIPAGTAMIDFHFLIGDSIDKGNHVPYAGLVHTKPHVMAPGAYVEWGLMRTRTRSGFPLDIVPINSLIEPNVTMLWVTHEWQNALVLKNMLPGIARAVKTDMKEAADSTLRKMASALLQQPDLTERQYLYIQKMYSDVLYDKKKADSLQKIIIARFPGGLDDRLVRLSAVQRQRDSVQKAILRTSFFSEFPLDKYPFDDYFDPEVSDPIVASHLLMEWATQAFNHHDWTQLKQLMQAAPFHYLDYFYGHFCMFPFRTDHPGLTSKEACDLSIFLIDEILRRMKDPDPVVSGRGFIAPTEWIQQSMPEYADLFGFHLGLLADNNQAEKAYMLGRQLEPSVGVGNITFNENYTRVMHLMNKDEEAIPFIKRAIFANKATPSMLTVLEDDYQKIHGEKSNFLAYYQSLRSQQAIEKEHSELEASLFTTPAPALQLPDMNGKIIDLAKLRGKIIVLDFWATWCYPCKAAMPGMQMAVDKYKQDSDVVFFFVSTMEEKTDNRSSITRFLKEKKYDFHVLCDQPDPTTHKNEAVFGRWASTFGLEGIPQKLIVDQQGVVRWKAGGFYGNVIQVADEVSYVIEYLKNHHS